MFFSKNSMFRKHLIMIVLKTYSWKSFILNRKRLCENMSLKCFQYDYSMFRKRLMIIVLKTFSWKSFKTH